MEDRAVILLRACADLLDKQNKSPYVLDILSTLVEYDGDKCDGSCLLEDIVDYLEYDVNDKE